MRHNWLDTLISPESSIEKTINVIDKSAMKIALVVSNNNELLGSVSDGDIRRALINQTPLTEGIEKIMNTSPTTAPRNTTNARLLQMMRRHGLLSVPLIDNGKVVGLKTMQDIIDRPVYDNPVFLMAGGFGTRLKPLTDNCPKPLLKLGDKPILEMILESFIHCGFHQFYISTHYMPEAIHEHFGDGSKWGVDIFYVHEKNPLGTGGSLGLLPKDLPDLPIIMMNGDVLTKIDFEQLLQYHNHEKPVCTMCVREEEYKIPYGVVQADGTRLTSLVEKPTNKYFINAGVYVVSRELIDSVGAEQHIDMTDLIEQSIESEKFVSVFPVHEYWLDIGKMVDFHQAQKDVMLGGSYQD